MKLLESKQDLILDKNNGNPTGIVETISTFVYENFFCLVPFPFPVVKIVVFPPHYGSEYLEWTHK